MPVWEPETAGQPGDRMKTRVLNAR